MKDLAIQLTHHPGDLARIAEALAHRSVNIKALAALSVGSDAVVRILPDDIVAARGALEAAHFRFEEGEVHVTVSRRATSLALQHVPPLRKYLTVRAVGTAASG